MSQIAVKTEHPQVSPYRAFADADNAGAIVGDGLFFNKGLWTRGEAKRTVPADARFVVNMAEGREGWCRWLNHMPVEYRMGRIADGFVVRLRDELGHLDQTVWETNQNGDPQDCWQRAYRLPMKDQAGGLLTFVGSSWGARRGLQQLYGRFDRERKGNPGLCPVVKLETEHRQNKQYGNIPEPRFPLLGWHLWEWEAKPKGVAPLAALEVTADDPRTQVAEVVSGSPLGKILDDEIPFAPEWRA